MITDGLNDKSIYSNGFKELDKLIWSETTGSTGEPFKFPVIKEEMMRITAYSRMFYYWFGWQPGAIKAKFWRSTLNKSLKQRLLELLKGEYVFCIYEHGNVEKTLLNEERIKEFINKLNELKPEIIEGYSTALDDIAIYMLDNAVRLNFKPKSVVSGAEQLTESQREHIEKAFGVPVFNRYSGTDSTMMVHECEVQAKTDHYLHIGEQNSYIEVVNEDNEKVYDTRGIVVVTDFSRKIVPFIRYKVGDIAIMSDTITCACGRGTRLIAELSGRVNDTMILPSGKKISPHVWTFLKHYLWIVRYQMIYSKEHKLTLNIVKDGSKFSQEELHYLEDEIKSLSSELEFEIVFVDKINPSFGGKIKQIIVEK